MKYVKKADCDCPRFARKTDSDFLIMGKDVGLQGSTKVTMGENVFVKEWANRSDFFRKFIRELRKGC